MNDVRELHAANLFLDAVHDARDGDAVHRAPIGDAARSYQQRTLQVRSAGAPIPQRAAMDAGLPNVFDVIRWFPETDGKKK